jgi:hypothetical protein
MNLFSTCEAMCLLHPDPPHQEIPRHHRRYRLASISMDSKTCRLKFLAVLIVRERSRDATDPEFRVAVPRTGIAEVIVGLRYSLSIAGMCFRD